jgi:enterochelin esterase-like enzyme
VEPLRNLGSTSLRAVLLALVMAAPALAQTRIVRVPSKVLGEERIVHVNLPPNYALARQRYQVIYLLDGHVRHFFELTVAAAGYDATTGPRDYAIPPQIVVGVDQRERGADLGRNQEAFTRFLVEELVPYIDREFRTTPFRTLIGHSLGGRFALMTFCRAPGVFPAVIAISPGGGDSTSADVTTRCLQQAFTAGGATLRQLVLSSGEREPRNLEGMHRLRDFLRTSAPPSWRWTAIDGAGLGHTETPLVTIPAGIRFIHDASVWDMPAARSDSIVLDGVDPDRVVAAFYAELSERIGSPVSPTLKWMLAAARTYSARADARTAESAVRRLLAAYPEDLQGYAMLSELALKRNDLGAARRALEDAMRMLERLDLHDQYDRERKREIIRGALAAIPR